MKNEMQIKDYQYMHMNQDLLIGTKKTETNDTFLNSKLHLF